MMDFPEKPRPVLEYKEGFALIKILYEDLKCITKIMTEKQDIPTGRLFFRNVFAVIEGYLYVLKCRARARMNQGYVEYNQKTLEVLEERREIKTGWVPFRPRMLDNLRITLRAYAESFSQETPLQTNPIPEVFETALRVRNRIMHPTSPDEMALTAEEIRAAQKALVWFGALVQWMNQTEIDEIERIEKEFSHSIKNQIAELSNPSTME